MNHSKAELIALYGEDWYYNYYRERAKKYQEKYRNSDHGRKKRKNYYSKKVEENPNFNAERYQKWLQEHPDGNAERYRKLIEKNPNHNKEQYQKYKDANSVYSHNNYKTIDGMAAAKIRKYNNADKKKGFDISNNISKQEFIEIVTSTPCYYCGDENWKHLGIDRINNEKPHIKDNVICACGICNIERGDRYSVEEFKQYRQLHPIILGMPKLQEVVEVNGKKVIKKVN